ncbi:Uma2 family endonuclease [Kamptonema animale CS-326]|jgi:Uma2 family endonuclease|uniref:Uma2 family endonuclease n=1 Tax=Kamptonema animale TaxID=92934 RepID=UPI00232C5183|nr:Uma2 family endonuclease [Kamptonema animale]MDB9511323.1 Uma2 family endonuclease [Kamptonema animale CS-326]
MTLSNLVVKMPSTFQMTDDQFFDFCQINRDLRIERTKTGEVIIMSPTGSETGNRNSDLIFQVTLWAKKDKTGITFDSSTGFTFSSGQTFSPDVSWIKLARWNALSPEQREKFAPICPDFVIELRSPSDSLKSLKEKMQEYIQEGVKLGLLIDRKARKVYIYRPEVPEECLDNPATVSGEPILPGFVLDLSEIW